MTHKQWPVLCAVILLVSACSSGSNGNAAPDAANGSVQVRTTPLRRQILDETLTLYGVVVQDPGAVENISFARPVLVSRLRVRAGEPVRKGQALLDVETDPSASGAYVQAQSTLELARGELKRTQELANERLATQSQLATARKALADADAALEVQRKLGAAPGTQQVRASRDGIVSSLSAQQGDRVAAGTTVLQVSEAGAEHALLGAEPEDIERLAPGMAVQLSPVFSGTSVAAKITQVFGVIDAKTQLVDVSVQVDAASPTMLPALKVRGDIALRSPEVFVLPRDAVLTDSDGAYLFQVANGHARRISVQVRVESGDLIGVDGKLDPALPVVVSGNYELNDGMPVRVVTAKAGQ
ncbi:efflux RND transporter periplasmic adaptor subunit [Thermomonas sp.]|uniref:efflux RND transporter periplasmic adaptor subunit n=1 Tax=Thermomonas sp. TaxID=1971895 RepID=UPI0024884294|nr:efflux RND transporter periplasmic adaptor subunit [Thermomonas sp.]MDI1252114.1 efflux RND transporter periplasmic adaptor subunit [Thermomonas sp.]